MKRFFISSVFSAVAAMVLVTCGGCGARGEVIKESIVDRIDKAIGEFKVKRKEIEINIRKLETSMKKIKEGSIKSKVQAQQLDRQIEGVEEKVASYEDALGKLREHMKSESESVMMSGKEYTQAELKKMAEKVIAAYKTANTKLGGLQKARDILNANAAKLQSRIDKGKQLVSIMNAQLEEIDAKLIAVNNIREAAELAGSDEATLSENFDEVQNQINDLFVNVETAFQTEVDETESAEVDIDSILTDTGAGGAGVSDIDAILGDK